jgi:hypothetical protein
MLWSGNCRSEDTELYAFPLEDVQRVLKNDQENEILKQRVEAYKQTIENDRQRIANLEQQIELQKQLIDIEAKRAEATAQALKQMTEVADRAIKLAEVGKPKSNWQTYCIFGLAMLVAGLIIAL